MRIFLEDVGIRLQDWTVSQPEGQLLVIAERILASKTWDSDGPRSPNKPEGRGFETQWREWICFFPIYLILSAALGHGVYSASNKNEYQKQKNNVSRE
jgi:hypothetical protein